MNGASQQINLPGNCFIRQGRQVYAYRDTILEHEEDAKQSVAGAFRQTYLVDI